MNYAKKHYEDNKEYYYNRNKRYKQSIKNFIQSIKEKSKCARCEEDHPACLDFHHIDSSQKEFVIAKAMQRRFSLKKILAEIEKCEILCANCHRKLHYEETKNCGLEQWPTSGVS